MKIGSQFSRNNLWPHASNFETAIEFKSQEIPLSTKERCSNQITKKYQRYLYISLLFYDYTVSISHQFTDFAKTSLILR